MIRRFRPNALLVMTVGVLCAFGLAAWRQNELDQNLTEAIGRRDSNAVHRLLEAGAHPDANMWQGYSWRDHWWRMTHFHDYPDFEPVLHCALAHKDIASALLLLQKGADINVRDSFGHTPLLIAVKYGEAGMVALLLKPGANIHVRDNFLPCSTSMTTAQIKAYRGPTLLQLAREAISSSKINARILRRMKISRPIGQRLADRMVLSTDAQKDYETIIALLKQAGENE